MSVVLTEMAASHVNSKITERGTGVGLRIGTRKSGCTGYAYVVDYADKIDEQDQVFESHGVKVVVDKASLPHLTGMTIDGIPVTEMIKAYKAVKNNESRKT